jgi:hypothetical protein
LFAKETYSSAFTHLEVVGEFYLHDFVIVLLEQKVFSRLVDESAEFSGQEQVVAEPAAGSMQWGLDGNGRSTNIFVGFEGTLVAGEDNYLAFFAELAENFYDAFVAFIVKIHEYIVHHGRERFGVGFVFIDQTKPHGKVELLARSPTHFQYPFSLMPVVFDQEVILVDGFDNPMVIAAGDLREQVFRRTDHSGLPGFFKFLLGGIK